MDYIMRRDIEIYDHISRSCTGTIYCAAILKYTIIYRAVARLDSSINLFYLFIPVLTFTFFLLLFFDFINLPNWTPLQFSLSLLYYSIYYYIVYFLVQQLYCPAASSNASPCHFNHSPYFFIPYFALIMMSFLFFSDSCWVVQQSYCIFWYALLLCYNSLLSNCNRTATSHTSDSKKHLLYTG